MEQFAQVNQMFWQGSPFQYCFYASIVLILLFEKRKTHKLLFGIFPIVMLVLIFTPLTSAMVKVFFKGANEYYVRMFTVIPVFYCMAHGISLLLMKLQGAIKLLCVCSVVVLIALMGRSIYQESWMKVAENVQKCPDELFEVLDLIPRKEDGTVCVAFPAPLYVYARQVDGNVLMPYGRKLGGSRIALLAELNRNAPDVASVMSMAGKSDADYIVVKKNRKSQHLFSKVGYDAIGTTANYAVYPVTNVPRMKKILNEKRQTKIYMSLDSSGKPTDDHSVISTKEYEYDQWGNLLKETYFDKNDKRVTTIEGYSGIRKHYTLHGLAWVADSIAYLDTKDVPMLVAGRYETRRSYVRKRELVEERYFDLDGQLMNRLDTGYAISLIRYDDMERIISERFSDASSNGVMCVDGYAGYSREYNAENNHITVEEYYDAEGATVNNNAGFARWERTYDDGGNLVEEAFYDSTGNTVEIRAKLTQDDSIDLLAQINKDSVKNGVGINYAWNDNGMCRVRGEGQGISWNNLLMGDKPYYFFNGETYQIRYSAKNVILRVYFYEDSTWRSKIGEMSTLGDAQFTVPMNCGAMIIRLWVAPGTAVNESVYPRIFVKKS